MITVAGQVSQRLVWESEVPQFKANCFFTEIRLNDGLRILGSGHWECLLQLMTLI